MPICSQCHRWIEPNGTCVNCGEFKVEMTAVDHRVAPKTGLEPLRPSRRPPVPLLIALDDDSDVDGDIRRLRDPEMTIGRRGADWTFSSDLDMSAIHAKIIRGVDANGNATWRLIDLGSSNGSFVRLFNITLSTLDVLMIGGLLMQWECEVAAEPQLRIFDKTEGGRIVRLNGQHEVTLGSDAASAQIVLEHNTIDPIHAVLTLKGNAWQLNDQSSRNGIWQRSTDAVLTDNYRFLLGEQRFMFRLPKR
jgi:hypothetical protein